jgi:hypothetical protein
MKVKFTDEFVNNLTPRNFATLVGRTGLYFIFLKSLMIPYPFASSKLIYIGMSESRINSIGNRLRDHVSGRSDNRGISGYMKKWEIMFTYFDSEFLVQVFPNVQIEPMETIFLESFADGFGTYPICNNKRGDLAAAPVIEGVSIDWGYFRGGNGNSD